MTRMKKIAGGVMALAGCFLLVGCGSPPVEESKPVKAGDGSQTPVAVGASGNGAAPAKAATKSGSVAPQ